jgi:hypothetical protein
MLTVLVAFLVYWLIECKLSQQHCQGDDYIISRGEERHQFN